MTTVDGLEARALDALLVLAFLEGPPPAAMADLGEPPAPEEGDGVQGQSAPVPAWPAGASSQAA